MPTRAPWLKAAVVVTAALFAVPFVYLVVANVGPDAAWAALGTRRALLPLLRSVLLATAVSVSATVVGTAAAWLVARTDVPGATVWRVLLPLPLVVPSFIGAFVLLAAFAPGGLLESMLSFVGLAQIPALRGFAGSFIVLTLFTYPYVYLPARARLRQLPPSLEESARLLGRGPLATFRTIVLPQSRSAILAGSLLVFLYSVSDFGVPQLLRYDTLTRVIYSTRLFDRPTSLALSLQLGMVALLVVVLERVITRGPRRLDRQRARHPLQIALGRWKRAALGFLVVLVGLALVVPVAVLAWWALRGLLQGSSQAGAIVSGVGSLLAPALNTSFASIVAAVAAVVLVAPAAYLTVRYRGQLGNAANAVIVAGFALPGLAIALALVNLTLGGSGALAAIYQTLPLLVVAYVVHFGAQAMRAAQVAVASVPSHVGDAARVLGAGRAQRFARIELPLMMPGMLAGAGLVLLSAMKELPATLLLAPAGFQTLATKVWQATESAFFADASILSLVLIALSGVLTWLLVIRRSDVFV